MHMKKLLLFFTASLLMAGGCGHSPKDISEIKDATPADSMMYYFGEMQAYNYWRDAETDTLLHTEKAREEFIRGFRTALQMESDNPAYNKGLQLGLRLAIRLREFEQRYGTEFSEEMLAEALEYGLRNDSALEISEAQKGYYYHKDRFEMQAASKELGDAKVKLARRGGDRGFEMVSDTLYALDVTPPTSSPLFKEGDRVAVKVTVATLEGKEVVTRQFPDSLTLGEGRIPLIVRYAIYTMTDGQTRQFMTTPRTLLGKRYALYNLPSDEPVIFTVKAQR